MSLSIPALPAARRRCHWVVVELDAGGRIDANAMLCLELSIDAGLAGDAPVTAIDLRDLTAIDAAALRLLVRARDDCRARAKQLRLVLSDDASDHPIGYAHAAAGLGGQLQFDCQHGPVAMRPSRRRRARADNPGAATLRPLPSALRQPSTVMLRRAGSDGHDR